MSAFVDRVAAALEPHRDILINQVERAVDGRIRSLSSADTVTFISGGRRYDPDVSSTYAEVLIAFMQEDTFNGHRVESYVTEKALSAVQDAVTAFYQSRIAIDALEAGIERALSESGVEDGVRGGVSASLDHLLRDQEAIRQLKSITSPGGQILDAASDQIQRFMGSAAGKTLMTSVAKVMSTAAGKAALAAVIKSAVSKVIASHALQSLIIGLIKSGGIAFLVKTAIGKALLALLAMGGLGTIPLLWVVLPLLAGFLAFEIYYFPEKLAESVAPQAGEAVRAKFTEINEAIVTAVLAGALRAVVDKAEQQS